MRGHGEMQSGWVDWTTALVKGVVGACPVAGPLIAEVVGQLIPNQRIDRIARFVRCLENRADGVNGE